jgi:hypothetical protein
MGISIYYSASRKRPLTPDERVAVKAIVSRFPVQALIAECSATKETFNGEAFCIYTANEYTEPGVIFEGATKLPSNSEETFWVANQYWCQLLSEVRRVLYDADWRVHIDDLAIRWDPARREYDPSM